MTKKLRDEADCVDIVTLCAEIKNGCKSCMRTAEFSPNSNIFSISGDSARLYHHLKIVHEILEQTSFVDQIKEIYSFAGNYDFREVRANGFRSYLSIVNVCLVKVLSHLRNLERRPMSVWPRSIEESLIAYLRCLEELANCVLLICQFPNYAATPNSLFPHLKFANLKVNPPSRNFTVNLLDRCKDSSNASSISRPHTTKERYNELVDCFDFIKQDVFYGRPIAFYLDSSTQNLFSILVSIMTGFADSLQGDRGGISGFVNTLYQSVASFLSPEERGVRLARMTRTMSVQFCKRFWSLAESRLLIDVPNLLLPKMVVVLAFSLPNVPLSLPVDSVEGEDKPSTVTLHPPGSGASVSVRLISKVYRQGMDWALCQSQRCSESKAASQKLTPLQNSYIESEPSPYLLVHIHGGGFVALSAETHDMYVRPWAEKLNCPILSLDYSLAPESPYPCALNECFYAVCWAMANRERLGARPDARVVICGDSAGGNLSLGVCLRAAALRLKPVEAMPAGAMIAYAPTLIAHVPSPSRMLSICDPLLPIGITTRLILAYGGIDEDKYLSTFNDEPHEKCEEQPPRPSVRPPPPIWSRLWCSWFNTGASNAPPITTSIDRLRALTRRVTIPECLQNGSKGSPGRLLHSRSLTRHRPLSPNDESQPLTQNSRSNETTPNFPNDDANVPVRRHSSGGITGTQYCPVETLPVFDVDEVNGSSTEPDLVIDTKLRRIRQCQIPQDGFLSPYLASEDLISRLPPLAIMACQFDPFLDDCLELAKRADSLGVAVELHVAKASPHAFLNFAFINPEYRRSAMVCCDMIGRLFRGEVTRSPN